jgi:hypothetical protein
MANFINNGSLAPEVLEDVFKTIICPVINFTGTLISGGPMTVNVVGDDGLVYLTFSFTIANVQISSGLVTKLPQKLKFQIASGSGRFSIALNVTNQVQSGAVVIVNATSINTGSGGGNTFYDPPTLNPNNSAVLFTRSNNNVASVTPIAQVFPVSGIYHYNVNVNAAGQAVSISGWGPGSTGLVNGY